MDHSHKCDKETCEYHAKYLTQDLDHNELVQHLFIELAQHFAGTMSDVRGGHICDNAVGQVEHQQLLEMRRAAKDLVEKLEWATVSSLRDVARKSYLSAGETTSAAYLV